jgi:CxxC motif-containing protein
MHTVAQNGFALYFASEELKADKEVVMTAVTLIGYALKCASGNLKAGKEVVMTAVSQDGNQFILSFVSAELEYLKEMTMKNGNAVDYSSAEDKAEKKVALAAAVANYSQVLMYETADEKVLVIRNGGALEFASAELQADKEVVMAAVLKNGQMLKHASSELKADKQVVIADVVKYGIFT